MILAGPHVSPMEAARRLSGRPGRFLLHSGSDADGVGRWSFVGAEPSAVVRGTDPGDLFAAVSALASAPEPEPEAHSPPLPRAVGYLAYDLADSWFGRYDAVWRHDATTGLGAVVGARDAAVRLYAALSIPGVPPLPPRLGLLAPDDPAEIHLAAIERALAWIRAGDVYQVNLARRLSAPVLEPGDPLALYERIARVAPAPYGALIETGAGAVLSDSPELFLRRAAGGRLETRPIKGTRARGRDAAADAALAAELAADAKERAEHLMIVDLERNDLGRIAEIGSVTVDDFARVVSLPTVHHLVSTVSCAPRAAAGTAEILRATFPGGSITGAPKIRAMQIIAELEPRPRGVYTGALGWLGAGGALDLAIVIRTAVVAAGRLSLHVGGGIVADSAPARELEETEEKAAAWRTALG